MDVANERQQKTITPAHVLEAVKALDWSDSAEMVKFLKGKQAGR
jgi:hypothetical protein